MENPFENAFDQVMTAVEQARILNRAVDLQTQQMAMLITGRLRGVNPDTLKSLKRELAAFDAHRGKWKDA